MEWLQGGPFLEISFVLELRKKKKETIQDIIDKLFKVNYKIEIIDNNIDELLNAFEKGYPFDSEDSQSISLHSLKLRLYVYLSRKRKAILQIDKVSSNALIVNFYFYGSSFDALEWEQVGIMENEMVDFTNFFTELFSIYEYKVGGIAYEEDVLSLFDGNEVFPSECYRFENISPSYFLQEPSSFVGILWNEKYKKIKHIPYGHKRVNQEGMLIKTRNFTVVR